MAHFAHVNNGIVDSIIVIEQNVIDENGGWYCTGCQMFKPSSEWIQTSYNTREGEHQEGGTPMRGNYAGIGYTYDSQRDVFIPPKPYASWVFDEPKSAWKAPKVKPTDSRDYVWSELRQDWVKVASLLEDEQ
jgi:hypothetical protein